MSSNIAELKSQRQSQRSWLKTTKDLNLEDLEKVVDTSLIKGLTVFPVGENSLHVAASGTGKSTAVRAIISQAIHDHDDLYVGYVSESVENTRKQMAKLTNKSEACDNRTGYASPAAFVSLEDLIKKFKEMANNAVAAGCRKLFIVVEGFAEICANIGLSEDNNTDMSKLMSAIKKFIDDCADKGLQVSVAVFHHPPHEKERARGAAAIRAASQMRSIITSDREDKTIMFNYQSQNIDAGKLTIKLTKPVQFRGMTLYGGYEHTDKEVVEFTEKQTQLKARACKVLAVLALAEGVGKKPTKDFVKDTLQINGELLKEGCDELVADGQITINKDTKPHKITINGADINDPLTTVQFYSKACKLPDRTWKLERTNSHDGYFLSDHTIIRH